MDFGSLGVLLLRKIGFGLISGQIGVFKKLQLIRPFSNRFSVSPTIFANDKGQLLKNAYLFCCEIKVFKGKIPTSVLQFKLGQAKNFNLLTF